MDSFLPSPASAQRPACPPFIYLQAFPTGTLGATCLFARPPSTLSDPTYPRSWDLIRRRVLALPSQPLPRRRTLFTLSSFRLNIHQLRGLLLVVRYLLHQPKHSSFHSHCCLG